MIAKNQKINDRYEIIKQIGEGGMANVYLARDIILDREVAIKVLRGDLAGDEKFVRRFQREALSASSLSHPNIVEMYDVGEDHGTYYIVMEYIPGKTLKQLIKKRGALTLSESIDIMLQLTDGINHAHSSYIIHRDIKPQNIMIEENGEIKITDFGIAMALNNTQLTQTNSVMGSVHYLPPEQASGKGATVKSDIYSMGILFYELLTGSLPFKGDNAVEIAFKHIKNDIPSIREISPTIPQSIENIVLKATAKNPKNRYNNSKEMHDDLLNALNSEHENDEKIKFKYPEHEQDLEKKDLLLEEETKKKELEPVDNEEDQSNNKLLWILSAFFIFLILVLGSLFIILPKLSNVDEVTIPNVKNMTPEEAASAIRKIGLTPAGDYLFEISDEVEKDKVIKTSPKIGEKRKKGSEVRIYVSKGKDYVIEDYTNKKVKDVEALLKKYELNVIVEEIIPEEDPENPVTYEENTVIKQDPLPGKSVKKGANITLYKVKQLVKYPDFTDGTWTEKDIEDFGKEQGITVEIEYSDKEGFTEGTIISQSRAKETIVTKGASIKIVIAKKDSTQE